MSIPKLIISLLVIISSGCFGFWSLAEARQVFTGVFREGAPRDMNFIKQFEQQSGKKPAMVMWYQDWAQPFPKDDVEKVISYGAVPHIVWEPWFWGDKERVKLAEISSGKWDEYLRSWARPIKELGQPIFLRVGHEFNIEGYPWGIVNNGKNPDNYIQAYRHVVDLFRREGANNVLWVWAPMNYSFPKESWNDWVNSYPGDNYVDWVGFDGYNWGTTQSWSDWQVLKYLFREQVRLARKLWPTKPIMIAEFASAEKGGNKAAWIRELPGYLKTSMRDIDAIVWFDEKKETDWRINSTPAALAAYKEIMRDPLFSSSGPTLAAFTVSPEKFVKKVATAVRARGVKIDGRLNEWANAVPLVMKDGSYFKEGLSWSGPTDLSGQIYFMYDDQNLYVAAKVRDKFTLVNKKERSEIWNGDGLEVVMSLDPGADPKRDSFVKGDYQLGFGTGDGRANKPSIWNWQRRRSPTGSEISVKKVDNPLGYILEAKIPWSFFGTFVPSAGTRVGFDLALDDADLTGERERQFIWNGDFYFYKDPSVWGVLEFR